MAESHQQKERKQPQSGRFRVGRIALIVVAGIAFVGAVVYAYDLGFRQGAKHAPPLITADTTPTKVPPESPGGIEIPHQDKLVYQRLSTAREPVETRAETLLPPPEEPLPKPPPEPSRQVASADTVVSDAAPTNASVTAQSATTEEEAVSAETTEVTPPPPPKVPSNGAPAMAASNAAMPEKKQAVASAAPAAKPAAPIAKLTAPPISAAYLVQLGSFRTGDAAQAGWRRLSKRHPALLAQLPYRVAKADLGANKGIYHRLQVGSFASRSAADVLCRQLKAQRQDCLIVKR